MDLLRWLYGTLCNLTYLKSLSKFIYVKQNDITGVQGLVNLKECSISMIEH